MRNTANDVLLDVGGHEKIAIILALTCPRLQPFQPLDETISRRDYNLCVQDHVQPLHSPHILLRRWLLMPCS